MHVDAAPCIFSMTETNLVIVNLVFSHLVLVLVITNLVIVNLVMVFSHLVLVLAGLQQALLGRL